MIEWNKVKHGLEITVKNIGNSLLNMKNSFQEQTSEKIDCCEKFIEEDQKRQTRKLWMRLGVSFYISEEEERVVLGDDNVQASDVLRRIVREGRFTPDGDSYIPEATIEQYNEENCCAYEAREIEFDA